MEDDDFKMNCQSLHRQSVQDQFSGYYYDFALVQLSQHVELKETGITDAIMNNLAS